MQCVLEAIGTSLLLFLSFGNEFCQIDFKRELMSVVDLDHCIPLNIVFESFQLKVENGRECLEYNSFPRILQSVGINVSAPILLIASL